MVIPLLIATRWVATAYTRVGARRVGVAGTVALTAGLVVIAVGVALDSVWIVGVGLAPAGVGIGLLLSPMTNATLSTVSDNERGQASGVVSTARQLGGVIGVGVMSTCIALVPGGDNAGAMVGFAITAGVTLAAVFIAARTLPVPDEDSGGTRSVTGMIGRDRFRLTDTRHGPRGTVWRSLCRGVSRAHGHRPSRRRSWLTPCRSGNRRPRNRAGVVRPPCRG